MFRFNYNKNAADCRHILGSRHPFRRDIAAIKDGAAVILTTLANGRLTDPVACGINSAASEQRFASEFLGVLRLHEMNHRVRRPQFTEEVLAMSEPTGGQLRTLAVRISEDLRAQLDVVAQITGRSTTEEIRVALEHWVEKIKSDPATLQKAEQIRADIEREAQTRRNAIAAIFGGGDDAGGEAKDATPSRPATRRGKTDAE